MEFGLALVISCKKFELVIRVQANQLISLLLSATLLFKSNDKEIEKGLKNSLAWYPYFFI